MAGIFGTDGVRANKYWLDAGQICGQVGAGSGRWFADKTADDGRMTNPMVVIGGIPACLVMWNPP